MIRVFRLLRYCPSLIWRLRYFKKFGGLLHIRKPRNLYEKIVQLSLAYDKNTWPVLADKYRVRDYIKDRIGDRYLNELYGRYDNANDVDFDALPESFALKTNNGCGTNIIVKDKSQLDYDAARKKLKYWLRYPYGELTGQLHYTQIPPCIIAEKYLVQSNGDKGLTDYKFFCVDGVPKYVFVETDRVVNDHIFRAMAFDMDWVARPELVNPTIVLTEYPERPESFDEMRHVVARLAQPFKFVRIDFYEIDGRPIFGEYTFTPTVLDTMSTACQEEIYEYIR